jgi:hypothetical protein
MWVTRLFYDIIMIAQSRKGAGYGLGENGGKNI